MADNERYDMVVIGAGIHGAGIAQASAAAGYDVLVLERSAVAAGTSSRSSKLIHGGLRYLESGRLHLVYECLHERQRLLRLAPGLVSLAPFYVPIYRRTRRRPWRLRLGLSLYALLGGLTSGARFRHVPRRDWSAADGLTGDGLQVVYQYWDARTDDAALTRAVMNSALSLGAVLRMPAEFTHARREGTEWSIEYLHQVQPRRCSAPLLINAAGPWVDAVLDRVEPAPDRLPIELVQGTHAVFDGRLERGVYYVEAPADGRGVFVMPWRERILVGTTETPYRGDPAAVRPLAAEVRYLTETLEHYFPRYRGGQAVEAFAGLRVLPDEAGPLHQRSRETRLYCHRRAAGALLTVYGGKLTAYRLTAERVLRRVAPLLPPRRAKADTRELVLTPDTGCLISED